jgi:hypothetical protein
MILRRNPECECFVINHSQPDITHPHSTMILGKKKVIDIHRQTAVPKKNKQESKGQALSVLEGYREGGMRALKVDGL